MRNRKKKNMAATAGNSLLIKHFPQWLGREDKESLLKHFGAADVVVMPTQGRMRNCVFATFSTTDEAKRALTKLHQLDVFGNRLVAEFTFAKSAQHNMMLEAEKDTWACNAIKKKEGKDHSESSSKDAETTQAKRTLKPQRSLRPTSSPPSPPSHSLCYRYPPPTPITLTNITNALVCVPKLYVQLLHLMNKMNLPPPFGQPTPIPPMALEVVDSVDILRRGDRHSSDSSVEDEGSEIDSDDEVKTKLTLRLRDPRRAAKRHRTSYKQVKRLMSSVKRRKSSEVEEKPNLAHLQKRIEVRIPSDITAKSSTVATPPPLQEMDQSNVSTPLYAAEVEVSHEQGFGVFGKPAQDSSSNQGQGDEMEEIKMEGTEFISLAELRTNRISKEEMQQNSLFRRHSPGEASLRLYVKNLAKQTTEDDLRYIYGRYINWSLDEEKNMFDVRVMQSGRMKGQAFIGLCSEKMATRALADTHGYILHGKPMAVQFARSSRPGQAEK